MNAETITPIALLFALAIGVLFVLSFRARLQPPRRELYHNPKGQLAAIGGVRLNEGRLAGHGNTLSEPLQLRHGYYRIDFQFDALTRVALVDADGDTTLFIRGGVGTEELDIIPNPSGNCRLLVEPAEENAAWKLTYGRRSKLSTLEDDD